MRTYELTLEVRLVRFQRTYVYERFDLTKGNLPFYKTQEPRSTFLNGDYGFSPLLLYFKYSERIEVGRPVRPRTVREKTDKGPEVSVIVGTVDSV